MAKFGKPADRQEWGMTPPTVNAYEDAQTNTINFPAGILQPPFFDAEEIDAVNYGAIGMVIGHEITHGFDDQGRKFDANGNLNDWWTPADSANYEERDKCIHDEYTQEVPEAGVKQNGKLSAGEDTADNGGVHLALAALQNTLKSQGKDLDTPADDGLTELQNFFLAYANVWCGDRPPGSCPHRGHDAGPFAESLPREQRGRQHARIRPRLRLPCRTTHGPCERVPGVVAHNYGGRVSPPAMCGSSSLMCSTWNIGKTNRVFHVEHPKMGTG